MLALIGESYRGVSDVQLAGYDVGDEASAVHVQEVDLFVSSLNNVIDIAGHLAQSANYDCLFFRWRDWQTDVE